jgi:hypothetical protein
MDFITLVLLSVISNLLPYIWTLPFILVPKFRLIKVTKNDKITKLRKMIIFASLYFDNKPEGIILAKKFIGYVHDSSDTRGNKVVTYYIFAHKSFYDTIKISNKLEDGYYKNIIVSGFVGNPILNTTINKIPNKLYEWQVDFLSKVTDYYKNNGPCTILLTGDCGVGKSTFGYLLAEYFKSTCWSNYDPRKPYQLYMVYNKADKSKAKPLIVCIGEIDSILDGFNHTKNNHQIPDATNYGDWNNFLSGVPLGNYGNVIIVCTTNVTLKELDSGKFKYSCTREGRFTFRKEILAD